MRLLSPDATPDDCLPVHPTPAANPAKTPLLATTSQSKSQRRASSSHVSAQIAKELPCRTGFAPVSIAPPLGIIGDRNTTINPENIRPEYVLPFMCHRLLSAPARIQDILLFLDRRFTATPPTFRRCSSATRCAAGKTDGGKINGCLILFSRCRRLPHRVELITGPAAEHKSHLTLNTQTCYVSIPSWSIY